MTQRVLVSVSVSTVVYTRILISDRIGECPYRPFSTISTSVHRTVLSQMSRPDTAISLSTPLPVQIKLLKPNSLTTFRLINFI